MNRAILAQNVIPMKDYSDPREQTVTLRPGEQPAMAAEVSYTPPTDEQWERLRVLDSLYTLIQQYGAPRVQTWVRNLSTMANGSQSVFLRALRGDLPADNLCAVCGWPTDGHEAGCASSPSRQTRNPVSYCDARPAVTYAVRVAILTQCGPALEEFCKTLDYDTLTATAATCGQAAVAAYTQERAK